MKESLITAEHKAQFDKDGFTRVRGFADLAEVERLRNLVTSVYREAKRGRIPRIRVQEDMPRIFGGINVAMIGDPFYYVPELAEWLVNAGIENVIESLTGWGGAEMELARLHVNGRFKHKRFWHRDARVDQTEDSIQINMYLKAEKGFRIMPAGEKYSRPDLPLGDQVQAAQCSDNLDGQFIASTEVGDIFIFKSYLLHQAYYTRPRMHLHLRFNRADSYDKMAWRNFRHEDHAQFDPLATSRAERWKEFVNYLKPSNNKASSLYLR